MNRHLVILARAPRLGAVKRRLARDVGLVAAWRFYRRTLAETLRSLSDPRWRGWLALDPPRPLPEGFGPNWSVIGQGPGDLGRRMLAPMRHLPPGPVVLVGSDIPGLDRRHVARAFALLGRHDAVLGPAKDGGFWLVGFRRRPGVPRDPFKAARWSSPHALADVLGNLDRAGLKAALADTLGDVDDGAALKKAQKNRPGSPRRQV